MFIATNDSKLRDISYASADFPDARSITMNTYSNYLHDFMMQCFIYSTSLITKKMTSFTHDDNATIEIPLRLLVHVLLTAAIVAIAAVGLAHLKQGMTIDTMEKQIGDIKVSLISMQSGSSRNLIDASSASGNIRNYKLTIPEEVDYLSFGVDPDPENDNDLTNTPYGNLTENGNVIYYSTRTAGKKRIPLEEAIEIREGLFENNRWVLNNANGKQYGVVLQDPGQYKLTFELVYDPVSKEKYTLIHLTDNLDAYINPFDPSAYPNGVSVSVNPDLIPADGISQAFVTVQLKDRNMRNAGKSGVSINLSATIGNLSLTGLITDEKGRASTIITSDLSGTSIISANSRGINPGSTHLTITHPPILLEIHEWINDSEPLYVPFRTDQGVEYKILLSGYGTSALWEWPVARIEIDGVLIGEESIDSENVITKSFNQTSLQAGNHTISIRMTNDFYVPFIWDRNLYVESVLLSD